MSNPVLDNIKTRRVVREMTDEQVSEERTWKSSSRLPAGHRPAATTCPTAFWWCKTLN